jgi:hypothetical protein
MRPSYCLRLIFQSSSPSLAAEMADNAGTFRYTIRNIYNVTVFNGPRRGHMEELQRVFGYLQKYTGGSIPLTLRIPYSGRLYIRTTMIEFYPDASEDIPNDMLEPRNGSPIDRLCRCRSCSEQVSRRSVTGIIMLLNNTRWYGSRKAENR